MKESGIGFYGISVDTVFSHGAFAEQLGGLPFELLADFERTVVAAFGVMREDVAGYRGMPQRSIFIIDPDAVVRWNWQRSKEMPLPDFDAVVAEAKRVAAGDAPVTPGARLV